MEQRLRIWPGVAAVALQWIFWSALPRVAPSLGLVGMFVGLGCTLLVLAWWLFFSRASWIDKVGALVVAVLGVIAIKPFVDPSIAGGAMGMLLPLLAIPVLCVALVSGAAIAAQASSAVRRVAVTAALLAGCATMTLIRTAGIRGGESDLHWRWTPTPEQILLTQPAALMPPPAALPPARAPIKKDAEWPGFRGANRDDVVHGAHIGTDWTSRPPTKLWSRAIGPGWSSFAVDGDVFYTQEQRGPDEIVACYNVSTGAPVWQHRDPARFYESNGGPGPRATPTLYNGRVYTFGATGLLNVLDEENGAVVWSHNVATDINAKIPMWGFTSSPVIVDDLVIVAASSRLAAYDIATGKLRWADPAHGGSYSSPHRVTIDGVDQIVLLVGEGVISVSPTDGKLLWTHAWGGGTPIVQPAVTSDGDVLVNSITATGGLGVRRLKVSHNGGWTATEKWTSTGLKPYFNDFVLQNGYAYGFDGAILSCIDLSDGSRKWKGGRYGNGQLILLADQHLLLVVTEEGELALVKATPDEFVEIAKVPAIDGKTWNHPVLVGTTLLVRNGEQMAAFRIPR